MRSTIVGMGSRPRAVSIPTRTSPSGRATQIYEFFDSQLLTHFWFIALSDGDSVQMLVPTFQSERAARIFERCVVEHPSAYLLSIDGQLELARRIEKQIVETTSASEVHLDSLLGGLAYEQAAGE